MTLSRMDYKPIASGAVSLAVVADLDAGEATTITIWIRTANSINNPSTFITDYSLEHEVISIAGLDEEVSISSYSLLSSDTYNDHYVYKLKANVD